jgi:hypothetical protein
VRISRKLEVIIHILILCLAITAAFRLLTPPESSGLQRHPSMWLWWYVLHFFWLRNTHRLY